MLPGMAAKPSVAIIGAGNLARALAVSLRDAGFPIAAIVGRSNKESLKSARRLAQQVGARATTDLRTVRADLVWFCVPDSAIEQVSRKSVAEMLGNTKVALHSSGALTSDELNAWRERGAAVASVHPMMTFVRGSQPSLAGVPFAIEGDAKAIRVSREIVGALGGLAYPIRKEDKAAYHTWGTFASPLFTALLATAERVASEAGVRPKDAARRMVPMLLQTLANYAEFGAGRGFSGPIIRGDVDTVKRHLKALRTVPTARDVYAALATAAIEYLPAKNKTALKKVWKSSRR
jgi:predicted short-subunit dehydrogenase-like oxidoreductase (DUF2520 family)